MQRSMSAAMAVVYAALCAGCALLSGRHGRAATIVVSPNVLVSRDPSLPHVEAAIATSPNDGALLIGTAIVVDGAKDMEDRHTAAFISRDGGATWETHAFAGRQGVDPQIAFGLTGTAHFIDMGPQFRAFKSLDAGATWQGPTQIGRGYDHPEVGVDTSSGPHRGRIYVSTLASPGWRLALFHSDDDGAGWQGPSVFADGRGEIGYNVSATLILHDGTLFLPYFDYSVKGSAQAPSQFIYHVWSTTSPDGGATFTAPRPTRTEMMGKSLMHGRASFAAYAVDPSPARRDRIYSVWPDESSGAPRTMFQYSSDAGKSWSAPRMIDSSVAGSVLQYQPAIAVSAAGVVGISWFDTRLSGDTARFDQLFSASLDGGDTFLPAVRVSSESSRPFAGGNRVIADRWGQGGDYVGLVADRSGAFHSFWPDSRSGTYQIWTARITVPSHP